MMRLGRGGFSERRNGEGRYRLVFMLFVSSSNTFVCTNSFDMHAQHVKKLSEKSLELITTVVLRSQLCRRFLFWLRQTTEIVLSRCCSIVVCG
jgi:hypothetical protein